MKAKSSSLLDIETIVKASEDSKMSSTFMDENAQPLERLSKKLGVSKAQATLFAIIASSSYNDECSLSDIKRHLGCENLDMLRLSPDLKTLQRTRLVRVKGKRGLFNDESYSVPEEILNCLLYDKEIERQELGNLDSDAFILHLDTLFKETEEKEGSFQFIINIINIIAVLSIHNSVGRILPVAAELWFDNREGSIFIHITDACGGKEGTSHSLHLCPLGQRNIVVIIIQAHGVARVLVDMLQRGNTCWMCVHVGEDEQSVDGFVVIAVLDLAYGKTGIGHSAYRA